MEPTLDDLLHRGRALVLGRDDGAEAVLRAARQQAQALGRPREERTACNLLGLFFRKRDPAQARAWLTPPPAADETDASAAERLHYTALLTADAGDLDAAQELLGAALAIAGGLADAALAAAINDSLANLLLRCGMPPAALRFAQRSLALKEQLGDRPGQAISHGTVGRALQLCGRWTEADAAFVRDGELAEQCGDRAGAALVHNRRGEIALARGDADAAEAWFRRGDAGWDSVENRAHAWLGLGRCALLRNRPAEAVAAADQMAAVLAAAPHMTGLQASQIALRGAAACRTEGDDALLTAAIQDLQRLGHPFETLPWLEELRRHHQRRGRPAEAVACMRQALDLLSECGSDTGLEDLQTWLREVDSPMLLHLALARHLPAHVIESVLGSPLNADALRRLARRQEVSVLFCDLRNYTAWSEGLPPEVVVEVLNDWFGLATRVIRRHGGLVDKFIGDAVMAVFGSPHPRPDAPDSAVAAALDLRRVLRLRNLRAGALGEPALAVGIGVHTGPAVVGFIGSHLQLSHTAIGDTVNVASRLEGATRKYPDCDILISEATHARQTVAATHDLGAADLKGLGPTRVFQVLHRVVAEAA